MKNLVAVLFLFLSITGFSQENKEHKTKQHLKNISAEEMAELQTKRLTLALVLNEKQANEIYDLNLKASKKWKEKMTDRKDSVHTQKADRGSSIDKRIAMLDAKIAHQEKMKNILDQDQFEQWRKMNLSKNKMHKNRYKRRISRR